MISIIFVLLVNLLACPQLNIIIEYIICVNLVMFWEILILCTFAAVSSYQTFQTQIPNGMKVPNPCPGKSGTLWPGVGHDIAQGSGPNNQFGVVRYYLIF